MSKGRKITIIVVVLLLILLLGFGGYNLLNKEDTKKNESTPTEKKDKKKGDKKQAGAEIQIDLSKERIELADDSSEAKQFDTLLEYGNAIYNDGKYSTYEKKNGAYFITLKQLQSDFNYDISSFKGSDGTLCDTEMSGIYFDVDHTIGVEYQSDKNPIAPILIGCTAEQKTVQPEKPQA